MVSNIPQDEINTIHCCFECPFMSLAIGGQVAICTKSNIGYTDKKAVNTDTIPSWCPIKQ